MTTQEIADRLVEMNRQNLHMEIYEELYCPNHVESIENFGETMKFEGHDAIKDKGEKWYASIEEVHEMKVSDPLVADRSFAVTFFMDITHKDENELGIPGGRQAMTELAVYHLNDAGKIWKEEFFA